MAILKMRLSIGYRGAERVKEIVIEDCDLEGMTVLEVEEYCDELAQEWANNYIEVSRELFKGETSCTPKT